MKTHLNEPHRSAENVPEYGFQAIGHSTAEISIATTYTELRRLIHPTELYIPLGSITQQSPIKTTHSKLRRSMMETAVCRTSYRLLSNLAESSTRDDLKNRTVAAVKNNGSVRLRVEFGNGNEFVSFETDGMISERFTRKGESAPVTAARIEHDTDLDAIPGSVVANYGGAASILGAYWTQYRQCIYRFSAQRFPGTECGNVGTTVLDRQAAGLPYCINSLQTNDAHGHRQLCAWIKRIFPNVSWVQAPALPSNAFQLRCLPLPPEARRNDLATPLARMGSGIGNIIAMLYVILTSRHPQVFAIDEPNAFLHPRALRELLQILESEGSQHQYILTGHSPDLLTAINLHTITLLELKSFSTFVSQARTKSLAELRSGLADLGISLTDLHGRDRVFWVEGQTEEIVMPGLLRHFCPELAAGTAVLRVEHTGTFSRKGVKPSEVANIYQRLSQSSALVPPMVCILLDRESMSIEKRKKMEDESQGALRFLDRRMLENFILHSDAIQAVLAELGETTASEEVERILVKAMNATGAHYDLATIDGARVLLEVYTQATESRLEFVKTRDVLLLINWILKNGPDRLEPLRVFLREIFQLPVHVVSP